MIPAKYLIKRIVAVEGDTVAMVDGKLCIDWVEQEKPFVAEGANYSLSLNVPSGHVLVLGDNRNNSYDGHIFGVLPTKCIYGRELSDYGRFAGLGPTLKGFLLQCGCIGRKTAIGLNQCARIIAWVFMVTRSLT